MNKMKNEGTDNLKMRKACFYASGILGAAFLMLLRICDKADALSVILVLSGLVFLVYNIRHARSWEYFYPAALMAITFCVRFYGYTGEMAADVFLGLAVGLIMFFILASERLFRRFGNHFFYTLIYPLIYFSFLYFTELVKINMPFRLDTYLSSMPLLCQITSVLGVYFLDFLLTWTASVIVYVMDHIKDRKWIVPVSVYSLCLFIVLCFGIVHKIHMDKEEKEKTDIIRIACVTPPYCGDFKEAETVSSTLEENLEAMTKAVLDAKTENAEILLFSEEAYSIKDSDEAFFLASAENLAEESGMYLFLAYEVKDTDDSEGGKGINKISVISDKGEIIYDYIKHCIIPVIETSDYVRGDKAISSFDITIHGKTLKAATAICYDSDFDTFMSHMGKDVDLLLLPTWDWDVIEEEHFGVARLRAIASETTLVRSVYDGYCAVVDSSGNVLYRDDVNDTGYGNVLFYDVPVR